jgi:anti-anti-sigma factor
MEITRQQLGDLLELKVHGRVDSYWADHLGAAVDQEIRQGFHNIQLDLSQVGYVSSAGIGTLVRLYKDLKSIQGSFSISNCSPVVLKILQLSKLEDLLMARAGGATTSSPAAAGPITPPTKIDRPEATYEVYALASDTTLNCQSMGDPAPLESAGFEKEHCQTLRFSDSAFAIGLGALGENFEECKHRFGEFIAAGGALAYLPTDGTNVPDFLLSNETSDADVQVCYALSCSAAKKQPFRRLVRFEAKAGLPLRLTNLLDTCFEFAESPRIGVVMIAESAGLIGAALRQSPASSSGQHPLEFPAIREWLTFTAEPAYPNRVVVIAGIALREQTNGLAPFVRPFARDSGVAFSGHFHAAAFSYRPVQRGRIDLNTSIKTLFENQALEGILHLLTDDRSTSGSGETELYRGACWVAPISHPSDGVRS